MKMCVHAPCGFVADPRRGLQIRKPRHLHAPRRTEVVEQRSLARGADAGDFIELALPNVLRASRAMRADREAMRLVAQPLQEVQHGITRWVWTPSRPASRSGPLAIATSFTSCTPRSFSTSRAADSWPAPPSINTTSGHSGGGAPPSRSL